MIALTKVVQFVPVERDQMTDLGAVLVQLKKERAQLDRAITALSGVVRSSAAAPSNNNRSGKRKLSAAARKRIAAAQRARWAAWKAKQRKAA
jgi:hypothetical protein